MRKFFFLAALFFMIGTSVFGQMNIKISKASANLGDTVNIDVTVTNFTNLVGTQFSINWDSTKFKFGQVTNLVPNNVLNDANVATPPALKQGQMTFLWFSAEPVSVPNDTRLFTLRLKTAGAPCDSVPVILSNLPARAEYYDANDKTLIPTSTAGQAKINGPGCPNGGGGTGGSTDLIVKAPTLDAQPNSVVCIPLTVTNFINIEGAQSKIKYDPTVLKYKPPVKYDALPNNNYNTGIGEFLFLWNKDAITIPNGERLMEICFDVIGAAGTMSVIDLVDKDVPANFETEYTNSSGNPVPFQNIDGKVTVVNPPPKILTLNIADITINPGEQKDVAFVVDNFIDISGAQFAVTWDQSIIQFIDRNSDGVVSGANGTFIAPNRYNYNFVSPGTSLTTLPNGSTLFKLKFQGVSPCKQAISPITVIDQTGFFIEFIIDNGVKIPYTVKQGSASVICDMPPMPTCAVKSSTNVSCNGIGDGSIVVEVTNAGDCNCVWKKDGAAFGNPIPAPNCNLSNIGPGVYTLEINCGGVVKCSSSVTITQPLPITISEKITNVSCGNLGVIMLTVSGGSNNFTYKWDNLATTKDIIGLQPGTVVVTVTDDAKCTASKSFTITQDPVLPLEVTPKVTNVSCFGLTNGSIELTIKGGCLPYKIKWNDAPTNTDNTRNNLAAGTYGVTVEDASNPVKSVAQQIVVGAPSSPLSVTSSKIDETNTTKGAITLTTAGGTPDYTYKWSDSNVTTKDRSDLVAGTYIATVTDKNGCSTMTSVTIIKVSSPNVILNSKISSEDVNNGYGVSCVNLCDGVISGSVAGGTTPYTIALSGAASKTITLAQAGNFTLDKLCVGDYTLKVTDAANISTSTPHKITSPTAIAVIPTIKCADGVLPTGAITLTVSGGAGAYTYNWSNNNKTTKDIENLQIGNFSVVVSDANGCQKTLSNISVKDCNGDSDDCFNRFTTIITPNNDGANDFMEIDCAGIIDNEIFIYDRWGNLVFSQKNYNNLWDGKNNGGVDLPENAYMWVINAKYNDGSKETFKGTVTLLRD